MKKKPHVEPKGTFSHYAYLSGPQGLKEPTALFDLRAASNDTRRNLIHGLIKNGELLATCPFGCEIQNMRQLRNALDWLWQESRGKKWQGERDPNRDFPR